MQDTQRDEELSGLCSRLDLGIRDLALLDRALTHASILPENEESTHDYESLEFLGDAVLGLAVAHYLYEHVPDRAPGDYSRMRAGLVNRRCLAQVATELDIAPAIRLGKGEEMAGGRKRKALLADCLEALIGAIYLDRGWEAVREFVARAFEEQFGHELAAERVWDFKSLLQNYCQAKRIPLPEFTVVRSEGPDHRKEFEVEVSLGGAPIGRGRGTTKKEAEQNAAREALEHEGQRTE
ncbi:MAG: ribonuclease III [Nitrospiraceae bacterium]|nr:ribonuclease III [Nitrospiraceae bacterium]